MLNPLSGMREIEIIRYTLGLFLHKKFRKKSHRNYSLWGCTLVTGVTRGRNDTLFVTIMGIIVI